MWVEGGVVDVGGGVWAEAEAQILESPIFSGSL
jgi:hypothetical protein